MADNLLTRDDTFLGVCEGLGEDLHVPANLLRVGLAVLMLSHPLLAVGLYLGLGLLVLASRLLFPVRVRGRRAPHVRLRTVRTARTAVADPAGNPLPDLALAA